MQALDAINLFRNMIAQSWPLALSAAEKAGWDEDAYFLDHWLQANWEILVERLILGGNGLLLPYGYNDDPMCRYGRKGDAATHRLVCWNTSIKSRDRYAFRTFVTMKDSHAELNAPFDYVAARSQKGNELFFFPACDAAFQVESLPVA